MRRLTATEQRVVCNQRQSENPGGNLRGNKEGIRELISGYRAVRGTEALLPRDRSRTRRWL